MNNWYCAFRELGLGIEISKRSGTTMNQSPVRPLNGVSRVRIPPPPLSTSAWQHGDSRLTARFWPGCPCLSRPAAVEFDAHDEARGKLAVKCCDKLPCGRRAEM